VEHIASWFHAAFLFGLFFDPEDGEDIFLRNVGWLSMDYAALHPITTAVRTSYPAFITNFAVENSFPFLNLPREFFLRLVFVCGFTRLIYFPFGSSGQLPWVRWYAPTMLDLVCCCGQYES
jgi:hypothetical protein